LTALALALIIIKGSVARSGDGDDRLSSLSEQEVADQRTSVEVNNGGSEEQKKVRRRKKRFV
jgi:hypothetical protein